MATQQKTENAPSIEKFLEEHEAYLKRKSKLINELSMSIFEKSVKADKDGKAYFSRESFIVLLNAIASNILEDSKITISVEPLLPEL